MMNSKSDRSTMPSLLNNKSVIGVAHLQPDPNPWIGVFDVDEDLLDSEPDRWVSVIVYYKGPFDCRREYINGSGKAKIIHARRDNKKRKVIINVQGVGPIGLDNEPKHEIQFHYNPNLSVK